MSDLHGQGMGAERLRSFWASFAALELPSPGALSFEDVFDVRWPHAALEPPRVARVEPDAAPLRHGHGAISLGHFGAKEFPKGFFSHVFTCFA